jgi:transcriptional regulator with PAS, ATPase and Fis domain
MIALGEVSKDDPAWELLINMLEGRFPTSGRGAVRDVESKVRIDGVSEAVQRLRGDVGRAATPGFPVLIHGETGCGKEVVAREIHRLSERSGELVPVNVAAIPDQLLESELFGSVKGAFTGAHRARRGLIAAAEHGTLFLDEVGDLDLSLQVKLLRFLESGEVRAVGADRPRCLDVRVVCATHRNLKRMMRERRFREDLYYRIAVVPVDVPPLRERPEDIPVLRSVFEEDVALRHQLPVPKWSVAADRLLMRHRWPGNVRELKHTVEVAMARSAGKTIRPEHVLIEPSETVIRGSWEGTLRDFKRRFLRQVLSRHRGNRSAAARELGISRQALLYQIKTLGLKEL